MRGLIEVARRAKKYGLPVITLAGTIGKNACVNLECGIDAYSSIMAAPCTLAEAIENAPRLLEETVEYVMRMILIGAHLKSAPCLPQSFLPRRALLWASGQWRKIGNACVRLTATFRAKPGDLHATEE